MRIAPRLVVLAILGLSLPLVACGGESEKKDGAKPAASGSGGAAGAGAPAADTPEAKVRATFQTVLEIAKAGDAEKLAPYVVYRGPDAARNWKATCVWANEMEQRRVKGVLEEAKKLLAAGEPAAGTFSTKAEKEGVWHVIQTTFGEKKAVFAFLPIGTGYAIGDID